MLQAASALVIAGSETSATLLSGCTWHLLRNPSILSKAQSEVRNAFSSADEIKLGTVEKLPYLRAVLEEALRMYPPVPSVFLRKTKKEGLMVDGVFVPGNVRAPLFFTPPPFSRPFHTGSLYRVERGVSGILLKE